MTYRDEISVPSLNGVEFQNLRVRSRIGRRTVTYEFPFKDEAKGRDLGKRPDRFSIDGVLVGDFYHLDLVKLRNVLTSPGPYEFQHPYWGIFFVQLDGPVDIDEDGTKGGTAYFSIPLVDISTADFPQVFDDPGPALLDAYYLALGAVVADFEAGIGYVPLGITPAEATKNRKGFLQSLTNAVGRVSQGLTKVNGKVAGKLNKINDLSAEFRDISNGVTDLLNSPGAFASAMQGLLNSVVGIGKAFAKDSGGSNPADGIPLLAPLQATEQALNGVLDETDSGGDDIDDETPSKEQEKVALQAMDTMVKNTAAIQAAGAVFEMPIATADAAVAFSEKVGTLLKDGGEAETASDDTYEAMNNLAARLGDYLTSVSKNLPRLREFDPGRPTHAILIAYALYGDASRDQEIIDQNAVSNPIYTGADGPLQVIDDG